MGSDARPVGAPPATDAASGTASVMAGERDRRFWLALSAGQVQDLVAQEAESRGGGRGLLWVVLALNDVGERFSMEELARDGHYQSGRVSQSTIISLMVLGAFVSGEARGVHSLADELDISASTTWRHLNTWKELCVLEERQDRRYQLAIRWQREPPKIAQRRSADRAK